MAAPNVISKEALLACAKNCLVEKGIEKFTLRAVADKAGVTQGTVYYHFRTKEQLLLSIVRDVCDASWNELSKSDTFILTEAIQSAQSRCSYDSFYHQLFISLVTAGFTNEKIREQLGEVMLKENKALYEHLSKLWTVSPVEGVSLETWGILMNAIVDGLALQALLHKDFQTEKIYGELERLFEKLTHLFKKEC